MFRFGSSSRIEIELDNIDNRASKEITLNTNNNNNNNTQKLYIYEGAEAVTGKVHININPGKRLEHIGIKVELIGQIEMFYDRNNNYEFTSLVRELEPQGVLHQSKTYNFDFSTVEKPYETYNGLNVRLRYFLRVVISRNYQQNISKELDIIVQHLQQEPEINNSIKMEVGIEDCLHIEFEYDKSKYHINDVICGKVYFLLVRIKIKHMELAVIRRESAGTPPSTYNESETLTKFELMDGAPVRGECIPIRLFLRPYDITPTYRNINNRFNVKYYLNLVLVDQEDRRYFKQQEILIWRRDLG